MAQVFDLDKLHLADFVRPGDGIIFGQGCGEPEPLTQKLVAQRAAYSGAKVVFGTGFSKTFAPEHADHLRFSGIGCATYRLSIGSSDTVTVASDPKPLNFVRIAAP